MGKILFIILTCFATTKSLAQNRYACFESDSIKNLRLSVSFDQNRKAHFVRYQGQKDSIRIYYSKIYRSKNPGGIPAVYWAETYIEKINGKITGEYTFTNAGTYQLDLTYSRKRDHKEFYFRIIEGSLSADEDIPFRSSPCF